MLPQRGKSIWKLFFVKEISGNCLESRQCNSNKQLKNGVSKRFYVASVNSVTLHFNFQKNELHFTVFFTTRR